MIGKVNTVNRKVSTINLEHTLNSHNGGYLLYWGLYAQGHRMLSDASNTIPQIISKLQLEGFPSDKIASRAKRNLALLRFGYYTWMFVWVCLIKPLGWFFSKTVYLNGRYQIVNDVDFNNIDLVKSTEYKFLRITFWYRSNQELTDVEIAKLIER